ncbi:MAG: hypothetical protein J3K34DRAFT_460648 [Monoraphidium minutum]|nr:MAG: hypothetical protein J3K34DRAFT_460648 [Monoraphidium minutum]
MGDPFDALHSLEEEHIAEGYEAGRKAGLAAGLQEGRELGLQKGFEIGLEVGHYAGCARAWRALGALAPGAVPQRAERGIAALERLIADYPLYDPQDERLHDLLEAMRARFKAVIATLGAAADYAAPHGAPAAPPGGGQQGGAGGPPQRVEAACCPGWPVRCVRAAATLRATPRAVTPCARMGYSRRGGSHRSIFPVRSRDLKKMLSRLLRTSGAQQRAALGWRAPRTAAGAGAAALPRSAPASTSALEPWPCHAKPIEEATTLPASWYTSPLTPPLEAAAVFGASWQLAGHSGQAAAPGAYFTGGVPPWRYVVARGDDGRLRAFHNVCRHHAAAVARGSGTAELFVCPYHGWEYDTRGRLRKAPRMKGVQCFKASEWGLRPIPVDTWGPFVFLWLGGGGGGSGGGEEPPPSPPPLQDWLGSGGGRMAELGLGDPMVHVARRTYELQCNWKVFADNYLDGGYHVPIAHPGLAGQLDLGAYASELHERISVQTCAPSAAADGRVGGGRPAGYFFLYPNAMVNRYGPWMDANVVLPAPGGGAGRCSVRFDWWLEAGELARLVAEGGGGGGEGAAVGGGGENGGGAEGVEFTHPGAARLAYVQESLASSHQVQVEDIALCEAVQAGLEEPSYGAGRYAPALEGPMFHFHRLLHAALAGGGGGAAAGAVH